MARDLSLKNVFLYSFVRNASAEDIEKLARAAINEPNPKIKYRLLKPFSAPRASNYVFTDEFLEELRKSSDSFLRGIAFDIMGRNPSEKMRKLALSLIQSGEDIECGVALLTNNFRSEDEELLYEAVKIIKISHDNKSNWHDIFGDVKDAIATKRGKPKTEILEYLYRNTLCSFCRDLIVWTMHKKRALSETILHECLFDSNDDIQAFAKRIIKSREHRQAKKSPKKLIQE